MISNALEQLENQAMQLSESERAALARNLLWSLDDQAEESGDLDACWADIANRRLREIEAGVAVTKPDDQVFTDVRKRLAEARKR